MAAAVTGTDRLDQLAANLAAVRRRIEAGCAAAGRDPASVTLIAVTKYFPAADVRHLARLGVTDVGESRDQEARAKVVEVGDDRLRWHFVGQLQRNKIRSVVRYAAVLHSLDRLELVGEVEAAAARYRSLPLPVLVQVALEPAVPGRGGAVPAAVPALAEAVAAAAHLRLAGVMAVAPRGAPPGPAFATLAAVAARLRQRYPAATMVSAGMSGDLEVAIEHGATHLRVGTALLGGRPALVR